MDPLELQPTTSFKVISKNENKTSICDLLVSDGMVATGSCSVDPW